MKKTRLLKDPNTGLLWLNEQSYNMLGYIDFVDGDILDLATCEEVIAEAVCGVNFGFCMASADFLVYKDGNGMMTVMVPYHSSWGSGAEYCSIEPGFSFRSVYGFSCNEENYIVAADEKGKWGVIRLCHNRCTWFIEQLPCCVPFEIVPFECDSIEKAIRRTGLNFSPLNDYTDNYAHHFYDLTKIPNNLNGFADSTGIDGYSPNDYLLARASNSGNVGDF